MLLQHASVSFNKAPPDHISTQTRHRFRHGFAIADQHQHPGCSYTAAPACPQQYTRHAYLPAGWGACAGLGTRGRGVHWPQQQQHHHHLQQDTAFCTPAATASEPGSLHSATSISLHNPTRQQTSAAPRDSSMASAASDLSQQQHQQLWHQQQQPGPAVEQRQQ